MDAGVASKRPESSQRLYLRAFCKTRKSHYKNSFTKIFELYGCFFGHRNADSLGTFLLEWYSEGA